MSTPPPLNTSHDEEPEELDQTIVENDNLTVASLQEEIRKLQLIIAQKNDMVKPQESHNAEVHVTNTSVAASVAAANHSVASNIFPVPPLSTVAATVNAQTHSTVTLTAASTMSSARPLYSVASTVTATRFPNVVSNFLAFNMPPGSASAVPYMPNIPNFGATVASPTECYSQSANGNYYINRNCQVNTSMPYTSMPYISMPYTSMPYTSMPYTSMPYASMPYASMPYTSMPHASMPCTSMPCTSTSTQYANRNIITNQFPHVAINQPSPLPSYPIRKVLDLPEFNGSPEQWPMFSVAYMETTSAHHYTNLENLQRLQKALKGVARQQVEALLIHPNNVDTIMSTLDFRFGRPEILIRSQISKVRSFSVITETKINEIVNLSTMVSNMTAFLESAGAAPHLSNPTLLEELVSKLPLSKREEWARYTYSIRPQYPDVRDFNNWLQQIAIYIAMATEIMPAVMSTRDEGKKKMMKPICTIAEEKQNKAKCTVCQEEHNLSQCDKFKNFSLQKKWEVVKKYRLCFCCLHIGHSSQNCLRRRMCGISSCKKSHNRLLHNQNETKSAVLVPIGDKLSINGKPSQSQSVTMTTIVNESFDRKTLLKFLPVEISGPNGHCRVFAFIDDGAKVSLIEERVAKLIGVEGASDILSLKWIGDQTTSENSQHVNFEIAGCHDKTSKFHMKNVRTIKKLLLPAQTLELREFQRRYAELKSISIDDYCGVMPQLLIGMPHTNLVRPLNIMNFDEGFSAHQTKLGWTLFGSNEENYTEATVCYINNETEVMDELHRQVAEYFALENFGMKPLQNVVSECDKKAEHILETTTKLVGKQFETGLLWKNDKETFQESYSMALKRLQIVENKMKRDPKLADWYSAKINEYVDKRYARKLSSDEVADIDERTWYLPHFSVRNINKNNKLRLVFDAAASVNNISLNSRLMKGPDAYQPMPMLAILFNFRQAQVGVCGDIREMFHRINIRSEDQNAQRFLWRDGDSTKQPDTYVMNAMIFGSTCSPCSAQYVKNLNAKFYSETHPRAVKAIIESHYVDDYVDSFDTVAEAVEVTKDVVMIHSRAGFELRGFVSNSPDVIQVLETNKYSTSPPPLTSLCHGESSKEKVLGMYWDSKKDNFCFVFKFARVPEAVLDGTRRPTKREVLSLTMSIFDPFGFLANIVIKSKILLQLLWRVKVDWNEPIPEEIYTNWYRWYKELEKIESFVVPRCYDLNFTNSSSNIQLHLFVDASEVAFSAVAYWRIAYKTEVKVVFVAGKSRCSPIKPLSVPRLELQAAVLGVRLKDAIVSSHKIEPAQIIFWSDSKTVLHWIRSDSRRYKQFVAHRIAEILDSSDSIQWRWVPGLQNPADDATRLNPTAEISSSSRWISGPKFLKNSEENWPQLPRDIADSEITEEARSKFILAIAYEGNIMPFENYSNYYKCLRIMSWIKRACFKFKKVLKHQKRNEVSSAKKPAPLNANEIRSAELTLSRLVQESAFPTEMSRLSLGLNVCKSSSLYKLTPELDDKKVLRLGGRIDNAECVSLNTKRPIILPNNHAFTKLIVRFYHELFHHQNTEAIIAAIRTKFWIPNIRRLVRSTKSNCQLCKNLSVIPKPPLMGQLPVDRLQAYVRPFSYTGVDYFGPVHVAIGRRHEKRWVALFTCLTTRAIHLELSRDLSTDAAILCLRNFINRRGVPVRIRSDRGTNFIGASKEEWVTVVAGLQEECTRRGVEWVFNVPGNPSAGGAWERMVRSVKNVLFFTLKERTPQIETLQSLLIEAECLVNSRPLTHLPIESSEAEILTPNHFLIGCPNFTQTHAVDENVCLRKQWRISQQLKQTFWKRWILEYLPTLTRRTKWYERVKPLKVGDVVIICDEGESRGAWKKGRIKEVYRAPDGQVRSALVKTDTGVLRRPSSKLAVLDVIGESPDPLSIHGGRDVAD